MGRAADVRSVDAVRAFKADLIEFQLSLRQTLEILTNEVRRGIQWLESDRSAYWPAQTRKASDALAEARNRLERCLLAAQDQQQRSCYDETKALEQAKQRLAYAQQKVRVTKHWLRVVRQQADEFQSRLARLDSMVENDLPRGIAMLERLARTLDQYVQRGPAANHRPGPVDEPVDAAIVARGPGRSEAQPPPAADSEQDHE